MGCLLRVGDAMRLLLLACLGIVLGLAAWGLAQEPAKPPEKPKDSSKASEEFGVLLPKAMAKKLGLNAEQREKVGRLGDEFREKSVELRDRVEAEAEKIRSAAKKAGKENDRATRRKLGDLTFKMVLRSRELEAEYLPRLRAVFTDEQKQRYDELLREQAKPPAEKKPAKPTVPS
jgi:hypothetical protein